MNQPILNNSVAKKQAVPLAKIILYSWLLIGTVDILVAIVQSLVYGGKPVRMLQFIASGVFGKQAFSGGTLYAFYGLMLHYCIAFIWTFLFFNTYFKLKLHKKNKIVVGVVYGIIVWALMNLVVMPLSNTPPLKFDLLKTIISMLIVIGAIGLPLPLIANKFFSKSEVLKKVSDVSGGKWDL